MTARVSIFEVAGQHHTRVRFNKKEKRKSTPLYYSSLGGAAAAAFFLKAQVVS